MKKLLLLGLVVALGISVNAQNLRKDLQQHKAINKLDVAYGPEKPSTVTHQMYTPNYDGKNKFVSIINIGTSANAYSYGYAGGQKSILAYNAEINSVTHFHRMGGELDPGGYSGDLGYDFSIDGGQNFTNMVECYVATENSGGTYYTDAARYPNHGIYNPAGNTDPNNAYIAFYVPTLDGTNSSDPSSGWGGHGYGVASLGDATYNTKHLVSSNPGENVYRYIPDAYTVTNAGDAWMVDINQDWTSGSMVYTQYLLVSHGVWNDGINDFEYEELLLECPMTEGIGRPSMAKVEFSPDGQTGYIAVLGDNDELEFASGTIFPILWKTTDGGETWDDPIAVEMAGPDGIENILYYISDEDWEALWEPPAPEREEVAYTTAFDFDMTVDAEGNPHIAVGISVAGDEYSIISGNPYYAIADIWSPDGGEEWDAYIIDNPLQFRSDINTDYSEDSRTQISRTHDGEYVFVGYLDTHKANEEANNFPDIFCRAIAATGVSQGWMSTYDGEEKATNVTFLSDGMEQAYFFAMANEVIPTEVVDEYIVPFTYEEMNVLDPGEAVQYKYIQDFMFDLPVGVNEIEASNSFNVAQNYPNPFTGQTDINVTLDNTSELSLNVYNLVGQNVYNVNAGEVSGNYTFTLNVNLEPGVYFYSVTAGSKTISKKMIVE